MYAALTVRKLKPGTYDDWRRAWMSPDEEWPEGARKVYVLRGVSDPDEVIAFGFFEGDLAALSSDPEFRKAQAARLAAMAPYVDSTGADGIYEVVEELSPPA